MEAKRRLAARLEEIKQHWDHAETDELIHLARDLYEGLVELRYQEKLPVTSSPNPSEQSSKTASPEPPRTSSEQPATASPPPSEQRSETHSGEHPAASLPHPSEQGPETPSEEYPAASLPHPSEQRSETPSVEHPSATPKSKILIDFNDRWAFVNKLFDRNQDDFNRVVSQLNTMSSFVEAKNFIEHVVKPDYNWAEQEEFEARFMELLERHFG